MTDKPFSAHDLDIDNSGSPISRMLRGKTSRPPTEEEIVDRTRREVYRGVLARCDVDAAEDASATTLLLQVDEAIGRLRSAPYSDPPPRTQCARCGLIEVCGGARPSAHRLPHHGGRTTTGHRPGVALWR